MATKKETPTAVAIRSPLLNLAQRYHIEPNKLAEVLRGTVIKPNSNSKPATNEELAAFCIVADQFNLNPWTREIYAFTSGEKGVVAIVPIDGWCKIVNRHKNEKGELDFDGCEFDETEGRDGKPISITCTMHVKGRAHPVTVTERFDECKRNTGPWGQHPYRMLRHKAYMQAARVAFGLGGIHDEDEARDIINVTGDVTVGDAHAPIAEPKELPADTTAKPAEPQTTTAKPEGDTTPPVSGKDDDLPFFAEGEQPKKGGKK